MKNFIVVLLLFVAVGTMQGIAQPQALDDPPQCIMQDGTNVAVEIISVSDLQSEEHLYASLSASPQYEVDEPPQLEEGDTVLDYIKKNWLWLLGVFIPVLEVIVRLTPTEKDNTILSRLLSLLGRFIPNLRKGGGTHATPS